MPPKCLKKPCRRRRFWSIRPPGEIERSNNLLAIFNVEGNFIPNIDYDYCFSRGIRVLIASPAFAIAVAEMALALALNGEGREQKGDFASHERNEIYDFEESNRDCFLLQALVWALSASETSLSISSMLRPFRCPVKVYDPWLPKRKMLITTARPPVWMRCFPRRTRCSFRERHLGKQGLVGWRKLVLLIPARRAFVLMSQAGVVDFEALTAAARSGYLKVATDVFPKSFEGPSNARPSNIILSAHRSAEMQEAFTEIGNMVLSDVELLLACRL